MSKIEQCGGCVYFQLTDESQDRLWDLDVPIDEIRDNATYICEGDRKPVTQDHRCHHQPSQFRSIAKIS